MSKPSNERLPMPAVMRDPKRLRAVLDERRLGKSPREIKARTGVSMENPIARLRAIVRAGEEGAGRRGYTVAELHLARAMVEEWDRHGGRPHAAPMTASQVEVALQIVKCNPIEQQIQERERRSQRQTGRHARFTAAECDAIRSEFAEVYGGEVSKIGHLAVEYGCSENLISRILNNTYTPRREG